MTTAAKDGKNKVDLLFRERKCFEVGSEGVQTGFVSERRGRGSERGSERERV